jgi:gliding motility-associated-like protein
MQSAIIFFQMILLEMILFPSARQVKFTPVLVLFAFFLSTSASVASVMGDSLTFTQSFSDTSKKDGTLSSDIDVKSEPGSIKLILGSLKNLGRTAVFSATYLGSYPPSSSDPTLPDTARIKGSNLGDGSYFTFVEFPAAPTPNIGSYIKVDLRATRKINSVVLVNVFNSATSYRTRARAFSLYSGLDSNSLSRVYQESDNVDTTAARYTMNIADIRAVRYLRLSIDRLDVSQATVISEMQIFGDGYVPEGAYISKVDSFPKPVNFARVFADAVFEDETSISFQMRTGPTRIVDSTLWSDWSDPVYFSSAAAAAAGEQLRVNEPRKYFQYRINLLTANVGTPRVKGISFTYQTSLIADSTSARIAPKEIPVFEKTALTYTVEANLSPGSIGFDTLKIQTPSPSSVQSVLINGSAVNYSAFTSPDRIVIGFPATILSSSVIDVKFTTKLISNARFTSEFVNKMSAWNPQYIDTKKIGGIDGWNIATSGVSPSTLVNVRVDPNPFTPNGDGKNDITVIDFAIANIEITKTLRIHIFDLYGKRIRTVSELRTGINPFYGDPRYGGKGIIWDGKNDEGKIVLPGVYLLQISIDTDNGGELLTKTVVVSY